MEINVVDMGTETDNPYLSDFEMNKAKKMK